MGQYGWIPKSKKLMKSYFRSIKMKIKIKIKIFYILLYYVPVLLSFL